MHPTSVRSAPSDSESPLPQNDLVLASAVRFLIDGGDNHAANVLLSYALKLGVTGEPMPGWTPIKLYARA